MTGADDPDDRRTYPWADTGGTPDASMLAHYTALAKARRDLPVLTKGDFKALLADDAAGIAAYGRRTSDQAALVVVNRGGSAATVAVPVAGYLRDGIAFTKRYAVGTGASASATSAAGVVTVSVPANGAVLLASGGTDLAGPKAPVLTLAGEGNGSLDVAWAAVSGAASYDVRVSPVTGGGYVKANTTPLTGTSYTVAGLDERRRRLHRGHRERRSRERERPFERGPRPPALRHRLVQPPVAADADPHHQHRQPHRHRLRPGVDRRRDEPAGRHARAPAQLGYGPDGSNPDGNAAWTWVNGAFNTDAGNNDEFMASLLPEATGAFDYAWRYSTTGGRDWVFADLDGSGNGYQPAQAGALTVNGSGDTTAPATPDGLRVVSASPAGIELAWDPVAGDPTLYGYELLRSAAGGAYTLLARLTSATYTDTAVTEGETWHYRVQALDLSFNRSAPSASVAGTAQLRTVTLTFNVTVPATTDATARAVNIAGFLDRLDGGHPQWNPGGTPLTRVDATHWTITFTGKESTQLEYKYALGDWDHVEKDAACGEVANRLLTLGWGSNGTQTVNDTIVNWRNVAPCGN